MTVYSIALLTLLRMANCRWQGLSAVQMSEKVTKVST